MGKYFGTDGIRGKVGELLTPTLSYKIGKFLGWYLKNSLKKTPTAVIGKDTRLSSDTLELAFATGLLEGGANVHFMGVTTTPSVSFATLKGGFDLGIVISASHNPYYDNGIKLLNSRGEKLQDEITDKIEAYLDNGLEIPRKQDDSASLRYGRAFDYSRGVISYLSYLISTVKTPLDGLKIGLDTANGAAFEIAKRAFLALGATVLVINDKPNGVNINEGAGSLHTEGLCQLVLEKGLDMGFAFDGDGDRCIAVSRTGKVIDGDGILYILARDFMTQGALKGNKIALTVMSNMGLVSAFDREGIKCVQTAVGDRFVYEEMVKEDLSLGGEQSGHIILRDYMNTGDGILTALKLAELVARDKTDLEGLEKGFSPLPQVNLSIKVKNKEAILKSSDVRAVIDRCEKRLSGQGRLIVRASGTEEKIRVSVEAPTVRECDEIQEIIMDSIKKFSKESY